MRVAHSILAILALLPLLVHADNCIANTDHRSDKTGGVLVQDFVVTGTRTLDSTELADITSSFNGSCFNDDTSEVKERIQDVLQRHGFFSAEISDIRVKPNDPLGSPKPVSIEAEIKEGPRYRLSALHFRGNRTFSSHQLRGAFPIHRHDRFETDKVRTGLESLQALYLTKGYLEFSVEPATALSSNATAALTLTINEGQQYHMGRFEVKGKKEIADALQSRWNLEEGNPFDQTYVRTYLGENQSLLGDTFQPSNDVEVVQDCRNATVDVHLLLRGSPEALSAQPAKNIDCDKAVKDPADK